MYSTQDGVRPKGVCSQDLSLSICLDAHQGNQDASHLWGQKVRAPSRKVLGGTMGPHKNNFVLIGFCDSLGFSMTTLI